MDVTILVGLGVLSLTSAYALFYPSKKIYNNYKDFKEQGEHKDALKALHEVTVEEAIHRVKSDFDNHGVAEQYVLVRGKSARGYSVAVYNQKAGIDSLMHVVKE
jgi:hypothetical protein